MLDDRGGQRTAIGEMAVDRRARNSGGGGDVGEGGGWGLGQQLARGLDDAITVALGVAAPPRLAPRALLRVICHSLSRIRVAFRCAAFTRSAAGQPREGRRVRQTEIGGGVMNGPSAPTTERSNKSLDEQSLSE